MLAVYVGSVKDLISQKDQKAIIKDFLDALIGVVIYITVF